MRKKGFTLIELLVVISIIALLLAIMMPALGKAKELARTVMCSSNLKQWGIVWKLFGVDNDDHLPPAKVPGMGYSRGSWINPIRTYWPEDKEKLLLCPEAKKPSPGYNPVTGSGSKSGSVNYAYIMGDPGSDPDNPELTEPEVCSYGMNNFASNTSRHLKDKPGKTTIQDRLIVDHWEKFDTASGQGNVPMMADSMWRGGGPHTEVDIAYSIPEFHPDDPAYQALRSAKNEMHHYFIPRHKNGGINMTHLDLSVRYVRMGDLFRKKWHKNWNLRQQPKNGWDHDWLDQHRWR